MSARKYAQKYLARLASAASAEAGKKGAQGAPKGSAGMATAATSTKGATAGKGGAAAHATNQARSATAAATQTAVRERTQAIPDVYTDLYGAVSVVSEEKFAEGVYRNVDGARHEDGRYAAFMQDIGEFIPEARQYTDPVRTLAYGTDASFYRLNPKLVVKVHSEEEVARILPIAARHDVPVTFRAAGTSLSGQAITDSVLLKLSHTGRNFRNYEIHGDGSSITVEPGLIGGEVNRILAAFHKKNKTPIQYRLGPDPASVDSCMVGGIVSNNSSGMCCGVSQNTYHTLRDMRIVFADGTRLDTSSPSSRAAFMEARPDLCEGVVTLAKAVQSDAQLSALIRRKYAIKNTIGYSLNALVDFPTDDPIEIIKRLMIGSEGTFGFVSQATYNTVPEWPNKASCFIMFPDVRAACQAASVLRSDTAVDAVELFDRAALRECSTNEEMCELTPGIKEADAMAAGLLVECRGSTAEELEKSMQEVRDVLVSNGLPFGAKASEPMALEEYPFHLDAAKSNVFWNVRKGLIPIVGGGREWGTSMLIEDVACPVEHLGDMIIDLIDMFKKFEYHDASCFGHALEGNLHLVFSQGFRDAAEVQRFGDMMDEMCHIVATKYGGSLKGEHGTGRNMAPYVEMEWGTKAYDLMWELKGLFDPQSVLNPGVILNRDPDAHKKFLKPSPPASPLVNRCIECGFCESNCPSKDVTLTPRQRIVSYREMTRLREKGADATAEEATRLKAYEDSFGYQADGTCAADGMCQEKCPVKINTGELMKSLRSDAMDAWPAATRASHALADNFGAFTTIVPPFLNAVSLAHRLLGATPMNVISSALNKASNNYIPAWNPHMPTGASKLADPLPPVAPATPTSTRSVPRQVVYVPSCVTRMMGPSALDSEKASVHDKLLSIFSKAGYEVIYPEGLSASCCGMLFNSRGFSHAAAKKGSELESSIMKASQGGKIPVVCDTSPCLAQVKSALSEPALRFALYEPVEFIRHFLMDKLEFTQVRESVAVHVPCSSKKMGIEASFAAVAERCAGEVVPTNIPCCGMAGDRGMRYPELTAASLQHLEVSECSDGYSTSRTCEMSLSNHSGVNFRGLVYLVDEATQPKAAA